MDYADTNFLASCFPELRNCWLRVKNFKPGRKLSVIKFGQLESLAVGELEESTNRIELDVMPPRLLESMFKTENLRCLVLLNVRVEKDDFISVVRANPHLETLYMEMCSGPTEEAMALVTKDSRLKNFSIKECPTITGSFVQRLSEAEIFILDHSLTDNSDKIEYKLESPFQSFQECNSLKYVNFFGCPYFNDQLLSTFRNSFLSLRSMNLGFTCITDLSVESFRKMPDLECLCIDDNTLSTKGLYDICVSLPKLQKLSLSGYNGKKGKGELSAEFLHELGKALPQLQHLSLRKCCPISPDFNISLMPSLRTVELDNSVGEQFISSLKCAGVKLIYDN
jgi:hypothetical protein